MSARIIVTVLLLLAGCRGDPRGRACKSDDQCGSGFDCFGDVCVQICAEAEECSAGEICSRYHCVAPGKERERSLGVGGVSPTAKAPTPFVVLDATVVELRAIRRELELLREQQARLTALLEGQRAKK